jgi:hypothetical protein
VLQTKLKSALETGHAGAEGHHATAAIGIRNVEVTRLRSISVDHQYAALDGRSGDRGSIIEVY